MNLCFVSYESGGYGANKSLKILIQGILERDPQSQITLLIGTQGPFIDEIQHLPISIKIAEFESWVSFRWKSGNYLKAIYHQIKFVFTGLRKRAFNARLISKYAKELEGKNFDLVYTNNLLTDFGYMLSKRLGVPHLWHIREFLDLDYNLYPNLGWNRFYRKLSQSKVVSISQSVLKHHSRNRTLDARVVFNGIDSRKNMSRVDVRASTNPRKIVLSIIGIIHHSKNQAEAIKALNLLAQKGVDAELRIVGSGDIGELTDLINKLSLEKRVIFQEYRADIKSVIQSSFAILVCSRNEGFGRVTAEAMAYGTPVIGFDNGGTSELIKHKIDGLLYKTGEADLSKAVQFLINNPEQRQSMVLSGLHKAKHKFSIEKYCDSVNDLICNLKNR